MTKTIVVPIDGSEHSRKALDFACDLATHGDTQLHLVHVPDIGARGKTLVLGASAVTIAATPDELQEAGRRVVEAAEDFSRGKGLASVSSEVLGGDAASSILNSAKERKADMIVMGSRGLSDLRGLLMGSVSHKVSHEASCTCVTVR